MNISADKEICLRSLQNQQFYDSLLVWRSPTAQSKWEEEGFHIQCWKSIYKLPYKCTTSTKLQSLQYRILHRYIPTRKFLWSRNVIGSKLCKTCFEVDTLQHFFYLCEDVTGLWDVVLPRLKNKFNLPDSFVSVSTVTFGYTQAPDVVNLILLLCKQYITSCKLREDYIRPSLNGAIGGIINHCRAEEVIAKNKNSLEKFRERWKFVVDRDHSTIFEISIDDVFS